MKSPAGKHLPLVFGLLVFLSIGSAQEAPADRTNSLSTASGSAGTEPPPLPAMHSPVDRVRELLAMTREEQKLALVDWPPETRRQLVAKLRQYEALSPEERELRLKVTELHFYLWPLMSEPATNRPAQLLGIPPEIRPLVEERLRRWDTLAADVQEELRANRATMQYLTELTNSSAARRDQLANQMSSARWAQLQQGIQKWQQLPEAQRARIQSRFRDYFDLTLEEKARIQRTLSEPERRQIERTLQMFGTLTRTQRVQCIQTFDRLAEMAPEERQQFLKNADRWKQMSPSDRQAWRDLVARLAPQPPLPPTWNPPPTAPPPLPQEPKPAPQTLMATNWSHH